MIIEVINVFVDREEELCALRGRLASPGFELVVIYGRRRVGKTRLVLEALKGVNHVYYLAVESGNLRYFKRYASRKVPELAHAAEDWESYFHFLRDRVVVIDEFPNLIKEDPSTVSVFQRVVDVVLKGSRTKLILLGSSISMMTDKVLSYRSPLYGRRTASIKLRPLKLHQIRGFFPGASWEELVEIYGFADGIPYYLESVRTPFWEWLGRELRRPDTFIKDEVDFLLRYEFREVSTYKRILEAVAAGKTTPAEIREYAGLRHSDIMPYLRNLIEVGLLVREVPVTEGPRSRRGRYYIADNFTAFWFRYVYPNLSAIEEGVLDVEEIRRDYPTYLGTVFERVCRQFIAELAKLGALPFKPTKIGKWWRGPAEIDILALNEAERKALIMEVKWSDLTEGDIRRILKALQWKAEEAGLRKYEKHYGIIARKAEHKKPLVWDLRDFDELTQKFRAQARKQSAPPRSTGPHGTRFSLGGHSNHFV